MSQLLQYVGDWGHVLAAALFAALAIWAGRKRSHSSADKLLVAALLLTATWSVSIAFVGVHLLEVNLGESLRNCAWLTTLFVLLWSGNEQEAQGQARGLGLIYGVLIAILLLQTLMDLIETAVATRSIGDSGFADTGLALRIIWLLGALMLTQRVFMAVGHSKRLQIAPVVAVMSAMWTYDLLLYASAWAEWSALKVLFAWRGVVMAVLAPLVALSAGRSEPAEIRPSRALATWGLALLSTFALIFMILAGIAFVDLIPSPLLRLIATGAIFGLVVALLVTLPSVRFRSYLKVMVAKHFFAYRYDYRGQWMAFADTIGQPAAQASSIYERVTKAVADITGSPGGMLLLAQADGHFVVHSQWNWPGESAVGQELDERMMPDLFRLSWVVDIDALRSNPDKAALLPGWLGQDQCAWALVPIVHFDQLTGALLLARPPYSRALDWEDFDMLRTAGRQVASYIAEAQGQRQLAESRRFDEFNRRFAFIMHDIKNLVSQLSLLSRNAERHADNPEFRADMVLTLKESVGKMNDMLARLAQHNSGSVREPEAFPLAELADSVVRQRRRTHPLRVEGDRSLVAWADPARAEQIVLHLVQNGIEASAEGSPVVLQLEKLGDMACLSVIDKGAVPPLCFEQVGRVRHRCL